MSTISAVKSWSSNEVLTASDLNAEFSNLITNCNSLNSDNLDMTANYTWTGNLQGASITATAAFLPDASGGANIGSASLEFGDLYLADTKTIYFGNDQDITLAHVADTGLTLTGSHANGTNLQLNNTATDGDAAIKFALSGTVAYSLGVEDGDSDKFVINYGTGALGAQPALEIDSSGNTSIAGTLGTTGAATLASLVCTAAATFGGGTGSSGATISTAGAGTFDGILKTEDTTEATSTTDGSLQTDGGLSVAKDAIIGDDLKLLSDSAVLSLGDGSDATLTHDGTTGVTIAANPIVVDSGGNLTLDAHTGIHIFKDAGTEVLRFTEGNSGDVTVKLATDGKDLVFTDNGDATNMKILDAAAGINVPGEVQTTGIGYTDGDNAITIADGGGCTFPQSATFTSGFSNNDQNITNVGNIALDTISSDAGTTVSVTLGTDAGDDFIVGNNNALVVEGDNDRVGIGTASPDTAMHIYNGSAGSVTAISGAALTIEDDAASYLQFLNPADTEAGIIFGRGTDNNHAGMFYGSDEQLYFSANNAERMRISSAGSLSLGATAVGGSPGAGSVEFQKDGNNFVRFWDNATATLYMQANGVNAPTTAMKNSDSDSLDITTFQRTNAGANLLGQSRNGLMLISAAPSGSFAVGTSNATNLVLGTNNTAAVTIDSSQNVGIAMSPGGSHKLDVTGSAGLSTGTAWTNTSDARIKKDVATITGATAKLKRLRPVSYRYTDQYLSVHSEIDGSKTYHSFVADEYETVFPDAVSIQGNLVKITPAVSAVQAQDAVLYIDGDTDIPDGKSVGDVRTPAVEAVEGREEVKETLLTDIKQFTPHDLQMFVVAAVQELDARIAALESA